MEAIVLAGGLGTRLRSVVANLPKPMAEINSKPFLHYVLTWLKRNGVTRVIFSVGYKWECIRDYFGENFLGMSLCYSVEDAPLGTGGGIRKALEFATESLVFVVNGDTLFDVNLQQLTLNLKDDSAIQLSLKSLQNFDRYGCVELNQEGYVSAFREKVFKEQGNINGGVYLIRRDIFKPYVLEQKFSFEEFLQENFLLLRASAMIFDDYFVDIGIPEDYQKAQAELRD